jgi:hypothetical protein
MTESVRVHGLDAEQYAALAADLGLMGFYSVLRAENGPDSTFMIPNGMAAARGWSRRDVQTNRKRLLDLALIECVRRPSNGTPALYRWRSEA